MNRARSPFSGLLLATALTACGGAQLTPAPSAAHEPAGTLSLAPPGSALEEPRLTIGTEIRVQFATLSLPPGATFTPPVSSCQDVLTLVRHGEVALTGIGEAEIRLNVDDAARFGPVPGGTLRNRSEAQTEILLAFTRAAGHGFQNQTLASVEESLRAPPHDDGCVTLDATTAPVHRITRGSEVPPLVIAGGSMRVRILLDADNNGARHGGLSIIEAAPDIVVPEHTHPGANEALFIEAGGGEMRLGDDSLTVRAGSIIIVPDDTLHGLVGAGREELRAIQVYGPSGPEQRFRRLAEGGS